ncbi:M18 family aminopeptidase [Caviibacter abscessus]|uniref:M18 family aminopeptidase n=1 Tax=Caviibacter abscessus TaxID=1766719 RepID=UPI000832FA76|nr:M18 family aminopeptidase [Caviibacter abscessus]
MTKDSLKELEVKGFAREIIEFIDDSPCAYHVVKNCSQIFEENGFERLEPNKKWELKQGGRYFLKKTNTTIIGFTIANELDIEKGFKIFASHTDSPSLRIKPNSEILTNNMIRLNTEVYGGPLLSTWFDRPMSVAGRVIIKSSDVYKPKTVAVKIDEPIMIIPNLAIHQDRAVNEKGHQINKQNELLPIITLANNYLEKDNYLLKLISKKCNIKFDDILDFDLIMYPIEKGCLVGANEEMISAARLDNLLSVYAGTIGLVESENEAGQINVFVGFDNEEIGSSTKQGADSNYLSSILERIIYSLGYTRADYLRVLNNSFILSADGGHVAHPSHLNKSDITNQCEMNKGIAIKLSVNQKYTSDGFSMAVLKQIVSGTDIKLQYFVNNSNEIGGSTIGPLSARHLDIDSVDLGVPMLSMHSVRELCGINDVFDLKELARVYFDKK